MRYLCWIMTLWILVSCSPSIAERNNAANALAAQGDYVPAVEQYQAAQVDAPDNAVLYFNAANALAADAQLSAAQKALQQAIARGDDILAASAHYNLGNLYYETEDYAAAVEAYQASLLLDPTNKDARYNLELALLQLNNVTPTAIEMQTNPEDEQVNPSVTPTPNPAGQSAPSPTPTPSPTPPDDLPIPGPSPRFEGEDDVGDENNRTPTPGPDKETADEDVEDAEQVMEYVESELENLPDYSFRSTQESQATPQLERDW